MSCFVSGVGRDPPDPRNILSSSNNCHPTLAILHKMKVVKQNTIRVVSKVHVELNYVSITRTLDYSLYSRLLPRHTGKSGVSYNISKFPDFDDLFYAWFHVSCIFDSCSV